MKSVAIVPTVIAFVGASLLAPPADAATTWTARIGTSYGTATLVIGTTTRLGIAAKNFRASTTYTVSLRRGSCSTLGALVLSKPIRTSSSGKITQSFALTTTQARLAKLPMSIRVGTRCGAFTAPTPPPAPIVPAVSSGWDHTCALLGDGTVKCWGRNDAGQLGDGTVTDSATPVAVVGLSGVTTLDTTWSHSCALLRDRTVKCWGKNTSGQLGDGTTINRSIPVTVVGLSGVTSLAGSAADQCALLLDRTVKCWGWNVRGQVGDGTTVQRLTPVPVINLSNVTGIAAGDDVTCAVLGDGTVECWGDNLFGALGNGTTVSSSTPVPLVGLSGVASLSAGVQFACALLTSGTVTCWGSNYAGELGDGTTGDGSPGPSTPVAVSGLSDVKAIASGDSWHTCALVGDGSVRCWGYNNAGEIGDGTKIDRSTPVAVVGLTGVAALSVGPENSCAQMVDRTVRCWGSNSRGQLGDGSMIDSSTPVAVAGL